MLTTKARFYRNGRFLGFSSFSRTLIRFSLHHGFGFHKISLFVIHDDAKDGGAGVV